MSKLEKRREKLVAVRERIRDAKADLTVLEAQIGAAKGSRVDAKRRLAEAEALVSRLRDEIKEGGRRRDSLEARLERDQASLRGLEREAREIEGKYEQAVLAEMVEREKQRDLGERDGTTDATTAEANAPRSGSAPDSQSGSGTYRVTEQDVPGEVVRVVDHTAGTETVTRTPMRAGTRTRTPKLPTGE